MPSLLTFFGGGLWLSVLARQGWCSRFPTVLLDEAGTYFIRNFNGLPTLTPTVRAKTGDFHLSVRTFVDDSHVFISLSHSLAFESCPTSNLETDADNCAGIHDHRLVGDIVADLRIQNSATQSVV